MRPNSDDVNQSVRWQNSVTFPIQLAAGESKVFIADRGEASDPDIQFSDGTLVRVTAGGKVKDINPKQLPISIGIDV